MVRLGLSTPTSGTSSTPGSGKAYPIGPLSACYRCDMKSFMGLGTAIKAARLAKDWSQEELAARLSVRKASVSRWESEDRIPNIATLKAIARELGLSFEELLGTQDASPRPPTSSDISSLDPLLIATWKSMSQRQRKKLLQIAVILSQD